MATIQPRYKVLFCYDIKEETNDIYFQFVTGRFVPELQRYGLYFWRVYHTAYGEYPLRQVEFLSESLETVRAALKNEAFLRLESQLKRYTTNYSRKVIEFRNGFQF